MRDTGEVRRAPSLGFTLVELLVVMALVAVLVSIAVPAWLHARIQGNEASAVSSLRAIHTAQASYAQLCAGGRYAVALTVLGIPPRGASHPFLSPDLTSGETVRKSGYTVVMMPRETSEQPRDCNGSPTAAGYHVSATPVAFGSTGSRSFAMTERGKIFYAAAPEAPNPPEAGTPID